MGHGLSSHFGPIRVVFLEKYLLIDAVCGPTAVNVFTWQRRAYYQKQSLITSNFSHTYVQLGLDDVLSTLVFTTGYFCV